MKSLDAWQFFHKNVIDGEPADLARKIAPVLGSDFGASIPHTEWVKALSSKPHMQTCLYRAMTRKYGDDVTCNVIYC